MLSFIELGREWTGTQMIDRLKRMITGGSEPPATSAELDLPEPFRRRLRSMYAGEPQVGADGIEHLIDNKTRVSVSEGMWLYQFCRTVRPKKSLEIGLAYGFSTVYFLAAIKQNGFGHHTAVDPTEHLHWHGIGAQKAREFQMQENFRFLDKRAWPAVMDFEETGEQFDVIFIDGSHRFDDAIVDFTLAARICPVGGYIILDDLWMAAIKKALAFIRANRQDFAGIETKDKNVALFQRVAPDARGWDDFHDFR